MKNLFLHFVKTLACLFLSSVAATAQLQLSSNCTVSILNRSSQVKADGTWRIDNVPANFGLVRVRATCIKDGITYSGQSDFINIEANIVNGFSPFPLGNPTQIPSAIAITASRTSLTGVGATVQLTATATYPDNSVRNITAATNGTSYTVSNPDTATVSPDGLVTARQSGVVVFSAINEGAIGFFRINVTLSNTDSDGDGIPDDIEIANGLNPNNPVDAEEDLDNDGLTNAQELNIFGTNIRLADTDGDGISDGDEVTGRLGFATNPASADSDGDGVRDLLEIQTGSNPNDRNSVNLAQALQSFEVLPPSFVLTVNTIIGEASRQLSVVGHLKDGTTIDLTSTTRRTVYSSDNLFVANFGSPDGNVFAGTNGTATITVSNSTFVATVSVVVRSSTPQTLGFVVVPGSPQNVDVSGNYAYVASGASGLQVVDVSDRRAPRVVAALDTPGFANDVKVVGNLAFVADGASGLQIISVLNPVGPVLIGSADTPGDAQDVAIAGNRAYVADGPSGLRIFDITDPSAPRALGGVDTLGNANGVDVSGNIAVVADGPTGIQIIDVTDPTQPNIIGSRTTGNARDVVISGNYAFVADASSSFTSINISNPRSPGAPVSTPRATGGLLEDVVVAGRFALGADVFFVNGIPIIDVGNPANPTPRAILDFRQFGDENGTGIAVDSSYVYLTAGSKLYIGQYLTIEDTNRIAPLVRLTAPADGATVIEGQTISVLADASDDVQVATVNLLLNGAVVDSDTVAPYEFRLTIPSGVSTVQLGARAVDFAGNTGTASNVVLRVIPDPLTTVAGRVLDEGSNAVAGVVVAIFNTYSNLTAGDGTFSIAGVPTIRGDIVVGASGSVSNEIRTGSSRAVVPVPGGSTDVGDIVLVPAQFITSYGASLAQCDDCFVTVDLPFSFPFFGQSYSRCYFDGNGRVSFNFGSGDFTESIPELAVQPLVSVLWNDWDSSRIPGAGIYYNSAIPGRAVFTWLKLPEYPAAPGKPVVSIQIVLFSDGRIQFGYDGVPVRSGVTGISPGSGVPTDVVDYRNNPSFSFAGKRIIAQQFSGNFNLDHGFILWSPNASAGFDVRTILPAGATAPNPVFAAASEGLSVRCLADKRMQLTVTAPAGTTCVVEASSDLVNWAVVSSGIAAGTPETIVDGDAPRHVCRFYRLRLVK